jgi:PEP-CTERM motif-containing protein
MRFVVGKSAGVARALPLVPGALVVAATVFLLGLAPAGAATITIDFENLPALPTQPNNFAAAGAMQTYTSAGVFSITGGVVLGNPTFLASFPAHGSAPNAYGTADFADPSLLSTIELDLPAAAETTSVSGVLFNGQSIGESYEVDYFSGTTMICSQTFSGVQANTSTSGFRNFSCSSTLANPLTKVTLTTPNAGLNGWDFFVDTLVLTQGPAPVPEPASLVLVASGAAVLGYCGWRRRKR